MDVLFHNGYIWIWCFSYKDCEDLWSIVGVIDDPFRLGVILYILKDYMVGEKFQFSLHFESGALFEIWRKNDKSIVAVAFFCELVATGLDRGLRQ